MRSALLSSLLVVQLLCAPLTAHGASLRAPPYADAGVNLDGGSVSTGSDAGSDAPFSLEAGVSPVITAVGLYDGQALPQGWWLSDPKMQALGAHVVQLTNERNQLQAQINASESPLVGYVRAALVGVVVGCAAGAVGAIYLDRKLNK